MKPIILLAALLLSSSIAQGELFVLFSKTAIVPCGAIETIDNHSPGNSSMQINVSNYFNGTSEDEMMIYFNETLIQDKYNHSFSVGEDMIFFVCTSNGDYHLVTNSNHPPFLKHTKDNKIVMANLVIEYFHPLVDGGPAIEKIPEADTPYSEYYRYAFVALSIVLIGLISYIYMKK